MFIDPRTGMAYLEYRDGQGRKARTACGHRDFAGAKAQADDLAAQLRHPGRRQVGVITLAELFDNYLREVTPTKGASKQAHDRRTAALVLDILGPARRAAELTHRDAARFVAERRRRGDGRSGARGGRPLRARALQYDVACFKAVLAWAVGVGMLDRNPLSGYAPPAETSPRRPIVTAAQYEALLAVSQEIHPLFGLALIVGHETGHRIGAVRLLRWADIDLEHQLVRWRGENDKIGYEHETWLTPAAVEALQTARRSQAVISEWVFPAPSHPAKSISRHLLRDWWERGQALAKLPSEPGRGWHSLRRQFATEMKYAPLKDLCALGGWKSPQTVLTCYQRADAISMQQALVVGHLPVEEVGEHPTAAPVAPGRPAALDRSALLERYAEHRELLFEIADLFRAEAPRWMVAIEGAMVRGDGGALKSVAHSLRGSAGNFMATETVEAALRLEIAAGDGDLILAASVLEELKRSVEGLIHELAEMSDRGAAPAALLS